MLETITELFNQGVAFITSPEFQAFVTAAIAVVSSIALMQNKLAQLKVANAQVQMAASNNEIATLKGVVQDVLEDNAKLHEENRAMRVRMDAMLDIQTQMALGSRLGDKTRAFVQERYLKLASEIKPQVIKDKRGRVIEQVKEVVQDGLELVQQVASTPIVQSAQTLAEKMKQV